MEVIFQGIIISVGNSPEVNPTGGNLLGSNLPTAIFWGFIFQGGGIIPGVILWGRNHQGDNLLGHNLVEGYFSRGQFSGRQSSKNYLQGN